MKDKIYSLDDIKKILESKDKLISITSKWWKRPWLSPNDDTVTENVILRIEKMYDNFWDYNIEEKEKALKYMQWDVKSLLNTLSNIKKDVSNKEKNLTKLWYTDLVKDVSELNKETDDLLNIINKKDNKQTNNITDILHWDTETPKKEEVKQATTPVVDTTKQVTGTTTPTTTVPVDNKLNEYKWRKLVYDDKWNLTWFISKKTWETVQLNKWETAQSKIDEWIKWYTDFKNKTKEYLNQFEWDEKDKAKKQIEKKVFDPWTWFKSWDDILWD